MRPKRRVTHVGEHAPGHQPLQQPRQHLALHRPGEVGEGHVAAEHQVEGALGHGLARLRGEVGPVSVLPITDAYSLIGTMMLLATLVILGLLVWLALEVQDGPVAAASKAQRRAAVLVRDVADPFQRLGAHMVAEHHQSQPGAEVHRLGLADGQPVTLDAPVAAGGVPRHHPVLRATLRAERDRRPHEPPVGRELQPVLDARGAGAGALLQHRQPAAGQGIGRRGPVVAPRQQDGERGDGRAKECGDPERLHGTRNGMRIVWRTYARRTCTGAEA